MLSVKDTGCGMTDEIMSHLFEPFFTTKERGKGTGLGLSTVYGIVKQSHGFIYASSQVDVGSTLEVLIPIVKAPLEIPEKARVTSERPYGLETVLLVEDEEMIRDLGIEILQIKGYTVLVASNGEEALQLCREHPKPIHLLLTDVVMPQMSGPELAQKVSAMRPETRCLFMSGYTDGDLFTFSDPEQAIAFIQKPFTPDALVQKVRAVLDSDQKEKV